MKTNKVSLLAMLALGGMVAFGTLAKAEDTNTPAKPPGDHQGPPGGPRGGNMQDRAAKMAEELGLSDDQKTKMGDIMKEQGTQGKALREDTSLSKEDRQAKMKALRESTTEKVKGVLTAEQFDKWQKMQAGRRGPGGPGGPGGPRGEGKLPGDKPAGAPEK